MSFLWITKYPFAEQLKHSTPGTEAAANSELGWQKTKKQFYYRPPTLILSLNKFGKGLQNGQTRAHSKIWSIKPANRHQPLQKQSRSPPPPPPGSPDILIHSNRQTQTDSSSNRLLKWAKKITFTSYPFMWIIFQKIKKSWLLLHMEPTADAWLWTIWCIDR